MFYATQRAALRAIASGHDTTMCVILNQCANTLSMVIPRVLAGKSVTKAVGVLLGTKTISAQAAEALAKEMNSNFNNLRSTFGSSVASPTRGQGGGMTEEGKLARETARREAGGAFNDFAVSLLYLEKLQEVLVEELERAEIGFDLGGDTQLAAAVRGFKLVASQLEMEDALSVNLIPAVSQAVKGIVEKAAENCNYSIDEAGFEIGETVGGWVASICEGAGKIVDGIVEWLGKEGRDKVWRVAIEEMTKRIEIVLRKRRCEGATAKALPRLST